MKRPSPEEYNSYYERYIELVPEGEITSILREQMENTVRLLQGINEEKAGYRYAPVKWSIKQVVGHVIDLERIFAYRALWFARNGKDSLPSVEQDNFVEYANFDARSMENLIEEFKYLRLSNIALFKSFDEELSLRKGIASGYEFTVRSLPFIMAGHELHHLRVITERYLQ